MAVSIESMIDGLTNVIRAIGEDGKLRRWFDSLARKPLVQRRNAILAMGERFKSEGEDTAFVTSVKLLADPRVFDAANHAIHDRS